MDPDHFLNVLDIRRTFGSVSLGGTKVILGGTTLSLPAY